MNNQMTTDLDRSFPLVKTYNTSFNIRSIVYIRISVQTARELEREAIGERRTTNGKYQNHHHHHHHRQTVIESSELGSPEIDGHRY